MINDKLIDEDWLRQVSVCTQGTSLVDTHIKKGFCKTPIQVLQFEELTVDERLWIVLRSEFLPEQLINAYMRTTSTDILSNFILSFNNELELYDIYDCHTIRWHEIYEESKDLKLGITKWSVVEDKCWRETIKYIKSQSKIDNKVISMYFNKTIKFFTKKKQKDKQIEQLINLIKLYDNKENTNG